ncbi:MAG: class I SAM-dependent methyltransferase [Actinomycetota bacterium]
MPELHPATRGFADSDRYERGRPDYPPSAVAALCSELDLRPGRTVLDLAAGTGKLTRLLVPSGANVLAVEPMREMRAKIGGVVALSGTAERIPITDGFVDAVTVGQAFHWFDAERALREIHRVLSPGGGVGLIWNARDERQPLQAALSEIFDRYEGDTPRRQQRDWKTVLAGSGLFDGTKRLLFSHSQRADEQLVVDRVLSVSFMASLPAEEQRRVEREVRELARDANELHYMTELYLGFRR